MLSERRLDFRNLFLVIIVVCIGFEIGLKNLLEIDIEKPYLQFNIFLNTESRYCMYKYWERRKIRGSNWKYSPGSIFHINPLSANSTKCSKTLKLFVDNSQQSFRLTRRKVYHQRNSPWKIQTKEICFLLKYRCWKQVAEKIFQDLWRFEAVSVLMSAR